MDSITRSYLLDVLGINGFLHPDQSPIPKMQVTTTTFTVFSGRACTDAEKQLIQRMMAAIGVTGFELKETAMGAALAGNVAITLGSEDASKVGALVEESGGIYLVTHSLDELTHANPVLKNATKRDTWGHLQMLQKKMKDGSVH